MRKVTPKVSNKALMVTNSHIGERLREERVRAGFSQTELAELAGVAKSTQIAYEQQKRFPDAKYLFAAHGAGIDSAYVITGQSSSDSVKHLDKEVMLPVAKVLLDWLRVTDREVTPDLLAGVITVLYDGAIGHVDEEHMENQIRVIG